jgi:hypothetical protein
MKKGSCKGSVAGLSQQTNGMEHALKWVREFLLTSFDEPGQPLVD